MPLLVVEDNATLSAALSKGLREDGFEVETLATGGEAMQQRGRRDVTGVILDLGLPDLDGLDVLRAWRGAGSAWPILVLTARGAVRARVTALEAGADDYVTKPFEYSEVAARIRALIRRAAAPRWAPRACPGLQFDDDDLVIGVGDRRVVVSPSEHALLGFLLRHRGETLARGDILEQVFGYRADTQTNLINVHVSNLRRKLDTDVVEIRAVRGIGYRLTTRGGGDV